MPDLRSSVDVVDEQQRPAAAGIAAAVEIEIREVHSTACLSGAFERSNAIDWANRFANIAPSVVFPHPCTPLSSTGQVSFSESLAFKSFRRSRSIVF
jgi:hypothetical protein